MAVLSGDGMIGAVADELRAIEGSVLAILPGGRGNDLARVLAIPADPVEACGAVAEGSARPFDLGEVCEARAGAEGRAFVGVASAGFDSDANRIANEAPAWLGGLVYLYGALRALAAWRRANPSVEASPHHELLTVDVHCNHASGRHCVALDAHSRLTDDVAYDARAVVQRCAARDRTTDHMAQEWRVRTLSGGVRGGAREGEQRLGGRRIDH